MTYDVQAVRAQFPALTEGAAHFDGPGGSQVPRSVAAAVAETLTTAVANRGPLTAAERRADAIVLGARQAMADLLGADPGGVVFGRSMTALTYDFARTLAKQWGPGDEIVVTRLDHDANIRPWVQAAAAVGADVRWAEFDPDTAELTAADVARVLSDRTRLVAVTAASNLLGTRPPIREIADLVHDAGALFYVDGVHFTAHCGVDVVNMGADLFACSPYKFFGPHCGVVAGQPQLLERLRPDKLLPAADDVPERFEQGTLPYELLAGVSATVDFIASISPADTGSRRGDVMSAMRAVEEHEDVLRQRIEERLEELPAVEIYSRAKSRTPTLLLNLRGHPPSGVYANLARYGVNAPAGSFYAIEAARWLGLGEAGGVRVGLAPYTDDSDVDRLIEGLVRISGAAHR